MHLVHTVSYRYKLALQAATLQHLQHPLPKFRFPQLPFMILMAEAAQFVITVKLRIGRCYDQAVKMNLLANLSNPFQHAPLQQQLLPVPAKLGFNILPGLLQPCKHPARLGY